jgi:nickel/cobalt transporter (NiCoT) family protein
MTNISSDNLRSRIIGVYGLLAAFNIGAWIWAIVELYDKPILLGTALVAYGYGLRHAVDADHIAAAAASKLSIGIMVVFPLLFTAGMTLVDTTDGVLMVGAYGWAFIKPVRKLYYNLAITLVSVVVALFVGAIEALGVVKDQLHLSGGFWDAIDSLNGDENFGKLGFVIIGLFVFSWMVSVIIYRMCGLDSLESTSVTTE